MKISSCYRVPRTHTRTMPLLNNVIFVGEKKFSKNHAGKNAAMTSIAAQITFYSFKFKVCQYLFITL